MDSLTVRELEGETKRKLCIPKGFRNLLECLTIEILRNQPSDINKFAADYFKQRLQARQENGYDECLLGSQIDGYYKFDKQMQSKVAAAKVHSKPDEAAVKIQANYRGYAVRKKLNGEEGRDQNNSSIKENQRGTKNDSSDQQKDEAAARIQATYRGYSTKKDLRCKKESDAATKIQSNYRGYRSRKSVLHRSESETEIKAATAIQASYRGYRVRKSDSSRQGAATKIQSNYRGYKTRKDLKEKGVDFIQENYAAPQRCVSEVETNAATKIQAGYRGYHVRKSQKQTIDSAQEQAATKIQARYRGYKTRKSFNTKSIGVLQHRHSALEADALAATRIQAGYRGYQVRKQNRRHSLDLTQQRAATKIQACYRGYKTRKTLKDRGPQTSLLTVDSIASEGMMHPYDSRSSFSLPEDVTFEGSLDDDSDSDIDKVVNKMQIYQESVKSMKELRLSEDNTTGQAEDINQNQV